MAFFKRVPDLPKWIASKRADGQVEYMVTTNRGMYQLNAFERRTPTGGHELAGYRLLFFPMLGLSRKVSSKKKELGDVRSAEEGVKKAAGHYRSLGESMSDQLQAAVEESTGSAARLSKKEFAVLRSTSGDPLWTITMMPDALKAADRLRKAGLVKLVNRPPTRAGNLKGADYVITPEGRQLLKRKGF
jgi:hypothetical protein